MFNRAGQGPASCPRRGARGPSAAPTMRLLVPLLCLATAAVACVGPRLQLSAKEGVAEEGVAEEGVTEGPSTSPTAVLVPTSAVVGTMEPPCPEDEVEEEAPEECEAPTAAQEAAVAEALGTFALRLYQRMVEAAEPGANLLFSPINVALGLSHLLLGARGETRERLRTVLALPPALPCAHRALRLLAEGPGLLPASQIFHHPELRLQPRFVNASWRLYGARPQALSGNESLDVLRVNAWARDATRGHVGHLLEQLPPDTRLLLLSAVYLRATWQWPFRAEETSLQSFERPGRPAVLVPTMTSNKYPVASFTDPGLQAQVGRLRLSEGLSLVVLLPAGGPGALQALEQALRPDVFAALLHRALTMPPRATALALPRFHLDVVQDVVPLVHDMDYGLFLDAELCGLAPGAALDALRHRAVLALDEAGVEAAAALAASLARAAPVLDARRPFLFAVVRDAAATPLFMGRLCDPQR